MARPTRRSGKLPAEASSFIGRRRELAELRRKLAAARLVSLSGPGGVGKSRLALRIATDLARGFPDGAWMVELAEIQDPALVANAVMAALDLRDQTATEPLPLLLSYCGTSSSCWWWTTASTCSKQPLSSSPRSSEPRPVCA